MPNITHALLKAGRHCVAMTKTRRAESVIVNLGQSTILGNDRPKRVVARTRSGVGARQAIVDTESVYFRVAGEANSLIPS